MTAATRRPEPSPWLRELARIMVAAQHQGNEKAGPADNGPAKEVRRARVETST